MKSDPGIVVRPMRAEDVDGVMALVGGLKQAPHWPRSVYAEIMTPSATPKRLALLAIDGAGRVAGFAVAVLAPPEAELESIAVAQDRQRRGVAGQIFGGLKAKLAQEGVYGVHLEVRESNLAARGFYAALEFKETGRRPRYYAEPVEDAVLMRLVLG
ncbi:MAG TPA: GNAT family N-acetyltransferase [Terracidiphilus sp.]|nr:GNAT family N-acetyltransferase [Terracidiphilus sp.]